MNFTQTNCKRLVETLSDQERAVLRCMGRGLATKQIASELAIADGTVRVYRERIYSKLKVASLAPATRVASLAGLL